MIQNKKLLYIIFPCIIFLLVFFLLPLFVLVFNSIYQPEQGFSFESYLKFFQSRSSNTAYFRSLYIGVFVTLVSIILSYPAAMAVISIKKKGWRTFVMTLIVLPLMTNPVARTFAWLIILGKNGLINNTFISLGLIEKPVKLLYTEGAIFVGLLQLFMPLMILSLISSLENVREDYELAAKSLGANNIVAFFRIKFPLTVDGMIIGGTLVFTGCITAYVTPSLLGGSRVLTLSTLLYQKAYVTLDWTMATTIAMIMFLTTYLINFVLKRIGRLGTNK